MDERTQELAQGNIPRLLAKMSIPAMTGMLIEAFYNVVDRMFVGRAQVGFAGPEGLAGLTICFPIMTMVMAFTLLLSAGGSARISLMLGQGNKEGAEKVLSTGFLLSIIIGVVISMVGLTFLDPLLRLFGADDTTMPYAQAYMRIIFYGSGFNVVTFVLNRYIIAQGRAIYAMLTLMIGCGINFILDPVFIFVFEWGVEGAALASVIAWAVTAVWVVVFFLRGKGVLQLKLAGARIEWHSVRSIISIGVAPFTLQFVTSLTSMFFNQSLRIYSGPMGISAMGAIQSVLQFFQMPLYGVNQGSQPIIGFNYGAKNFERVRRTLRIALVVGACVGVIGFGVAMSIPHLLIGIFGNNPEMLAIGGRSMRIFMALFPVITIYVQGANYFSSTGRPVQAMMITLSKQAMLVPGLLLLPRFLGVDGVFAAAPAADCVSIVIGMFLLKREWKRLKQLS